MKSITPAWHANAFKYIPLAAAIIIFLIAASVPYSWLISNFGYDDILREPAADILIKFHAGGSALVFAWFAFAMACLLFIPVVILLDRMLDKSSPSAVALGIASAVAQAIGLLRWVIVVPPLANAYVDPVTPAENLGTLTLIFDTVHHYGGMVIGEMIGQLLLAGWTLMVCLQLLRRSDIPGWVAIFGLLTLPLWILGQTELLHIVIKAVPAFEVIPLAFMLWQGWLLTLSIVLIWKFKKALS